MVLNLYTRVLPDEHRSILWNACWQFWKLRLCWIQVPPLAVMGEGDAGLAAQPSPAVSDHCGDALITVELGNDFTLLLLCFVLPGENTASRRGMWR